MAGIYAVPKREIEVVAVLPGHAPFPARLFVGERAETHAGQERASDLLNGQQDFLPAIDRAGRVVLLNLETLVMLTVAAEHEFGADAPESIAESLGQVIRAEVEVALEDGSSEQGEVAYVMPEAHRRIQDFLNGPERFLRLRQKAAARLINKRRISRLVLLRAEEGS